VLVVMEQRKGQVGEELACRLLQVHHALALGPVSRLGVTRWWLLWTTDLCRV
jgi:hypothetical protein